MNFRFTVICFFLGTLSVFSQDSIPVLLRVREGLSPIVRFSETSGIVNPAAMPYVGAPELTRLDLEAGDRSGNAGLLQEGTGDKNFTIGARSFLRREKSTIWGDASYKNGRKDNVRWNESSDFSVIYPYLMGDSVGRDNLKHESYQFSGGYARVYRRISWGLQLKYRALMEYRTQDPRPENTTSDLLFSGGINYRIHENYAVGTGGSVRKYKQNNKLEFYGLLGMPKIYHLTGLGMDAYMFAGNNLNVLLDGFSYSINFQLVPVYSTGFYSSLSYTNFTLDKQMIDFQYLPISYIDEDKYEGTISYLVKNNKGSWGVRLSGSYSDRIGTEDKFYSPQFANYIKISSGRMYSNTITSANLSLLYESNSSCPVVGFASPFARMLRMDEKYKVPVRKMEITQMEAGLESGLSALYRKFLFTVTSGLSYTGCLDSDLLLTGLPEERSISQMLHTNYTYLSSNRLNINLLASVNYMVSPDVSMYLSVDWKYNNCMENDLYSNYTNLALGVVF